VLHNALEGALTSKGQISQILTTYSNCLSHHAYSILTEQGLVDLASARHFAGSGNRLSAASFPEELLNDDCTQEDEEGNLASTSHITQSSSHSSSESTLRHRRKPVKDNSSNEEGDGIEKVTTLVEPSSGEQQLSDRAQVNERAGRVGVHDCDGRVEWTGKQQLLLHRWVGKRPPQELDSVRRAFDDVIRIARTVAQEQQKVLAIIDPAKGMKAIQQHNDSITPS
jgi:hypothetical protein